MESESHIMFEIHSICLQHYQVVVVVIVLDKTWKQIHKTSKDNNNEGENDWLQRQKKKPMRFNSPTVVSVIVLDFPKFNVMDVMSVCLSNVQDERVHGNIHGRTLTDLLGGTSSSSTSWVRSGSVLCIHGLQMQFCIILLLLLLLLSHAILNSKRFSFTVMPKRFLWQFTLFLYGLFTFMLHR